MHDQPFVLGVNYWPRRKAMYWWSQFEAGEVREEFEIIAIQHFAATSPRVRPPQRTVTLDVPPELYYQAPWITPGDCTRNSWARASQGAHEASINQKHATFGRFSHQMPYVGILNPRSRS